jgi:hypothetical protein
MHIPFFRKLERKCRQVFFEDVEIVRAGPFVLTELGREKDTSGRDIEL